jgi:hypothetical protein
VRSIWFAVFGATLDDVEACLAEAGFEALFRDKHQWSYPSTRSTVLFAHVSPYDLPETLPEEHEDVLAATGARVPSVWVGADVSGGADGTAEVRHMAEAVMSRFDALAFDDFTSYAHAWTLDEIRADATFDGLRYFDYLGHHERSRSHVRRRPAGKDS